MNYGDAAKLRHEEYKKAHYKEVEERTDDRGLLWFANDYYQSYLTLQETHPKHTELLSPKFYLLCHAFELTIKSWLRKEGWTTKQLRDMDHNLIALLAELIDNHGVVVPPDAIQAIELANHYYNTKQYEYFVRGAKTLPDPEHLSTYVRLFLGMTKSHVVGFESIKPKPAPESEK
jgi:hypothetical protein